MTRTAALDVYIDTSVAGAGDALRAALGDGKIEELLSAPGTTVNTALLTPALAVSNGRRNLAGRRVALGGNGPLGRNDEGKRRGWESASVRCDGDRRCISPGSLLYFAYGDARGIRPLAPDRSSLCTAGLTPRGVTL